MRVEIRRIQKQLGLTCLYVTHDQKEALTLADRIVVMNKGRVEQIDTPFELYANPATLFVADFIGQANVLPALAADGPADSLPVSCYGRNYAVRYLRNRTYAKNGAVSLVVRPESLRLGAPTESTLPGAVQLRTFVGDRLEYEIALPDGKVIHVEEPYMIGVPVHEEGEAVGVIVSPADIVALPG